MGLAKSLLVKRTIVENPFKSTHFAWTNICLERYGYQNLSYMEEALSLFRNEFSICSPDYFQMSLMDEPKEVTQNAHNYMCAGFFTGSAHCVSHVCHAIEREFLEYLLQGWIAAVPQLYYPIYFKHPDWFELYYGDLETLITNYHEIRQKPDTILDKFIKNCFDHQFYPACYKACQRLLASYGQKYFTLTLEQLQRVCYYKEMSHLLYHPLQITPQSPQVPSTIITLMYDITHTQRMEKYWVQAEPWAKLTFPMIIWTNQSFIYARIQHLFKDKSNVIIYQRELDEFEPISKDLARITHLHREYIVINRCESKDTVPYHMLMYSRPHMWRESIEKNPFNTKTFMCLDFGLTRFTENLSVIENWVIGERVKMLMINPYLPSNPPPATYFHTIRHNVAGGLLTGGGAQILELIKLFDIERERMMSDQWCQLDEAIMACVIRKYPNLCDFYYGDYCGIISNYEKTIKLKQISSIIQKYLDDYCHKEAQKVINSIDYTFQAEALYTR